MPDSGFDTGKDSPMMSQYGIRQSSGIICPANRDSTGPAKQRIHCLVWRDMEDFWENSDASGWPPFCSGPCHFGKMDANQRSRAFRAHKAWLSLKANLNRRMRWLDTLRLKDRFGRRI